MSIRLPAGRDKQAWQAAVRDADDATLTRSQRFVLMRLTEAGFNDFDPLRVVGGYWNLHVLHDRAAVPVLTRPAAG